MLTAKSSKNAAMTLMRSRTRKTKKLIFSYGTILFMIFSVFSIASLYLMRENILSNSNAVGHEVVQRLDSSLQVEFEKQKQFVEFMAHYADVFLQDHAEDADGGRAAFDLWMKQTEEELRDKQSDMRIDIYASIYGQIVSPTYWDGDAFLVTEARPWYKKAMTADAGRAVILDPYTDIFTNTLITTVAARIGKTDNVIAIDLYLESASQSSTFASLVPENYCFYLVDGNGTVVLYYTPFNANYSQIQRYVNSFFESHVKNKDPNAAIAEPITDLIGEKRNVFTTFNPETGWYTIVTTLYSDILYNYHMISNLFLLMVVIFIIIEVWMVWREYHLSSQIETTNEALKVLGNSYQIILRVNFKMGTFTTLKAPDMMRLRLASRNNFDDLISVFSDIVLPESWNNFYKNFSLNHLRNLASLSIRDFGHDYQLKLNNDNRYKWFNARILFDESLDLDESIICFKLIDEEKITELEEHQLLTDALESAKKNEESKNVFFANMSHDMRTPLNGIIGLCQIGMNHLKSNDSQHLPDVFKKMTTASHQLLALVDDILEVARPQMESKLTLAPFDIVHEIKENIDVFKVNAKQQGKKVNLNFDVKHQVVIGDAAKLRQILNNLVSNSLKYSHQGCVVNVRIREILHLHKPSFMVEVADTGIGMDREFLKKLFNPYSREQRLNSVQGTGLGMSIVKNVVNIMGGDIKVKSTVNVGTTFTINLPFRLADETTAAQIKHKLEVEESGNDLTINPAAASSQRLNAAAPAVAADTTPTGGAVAASATAAVKAADTVQTKSARTPEERQRAAFVDNFSLSGLNILIVEDNQLNMEIACDILSMKGVKLTCAWDGLQAVDIYNKNEPFTFDAILMDMRMPKMDGCEASSTIRASDKEDATTIPIIACTANAFTEDIAATQSAGMNAHVSKPLDFSVLEHVLAKVIASRSDFSKLVAVRASQLAAEKDKNASANASAALSNDNAAAAATAAAATAAATVAADTAVPHVADKSEAEAEAKTEATTTTLAALAEAKTAEDSGEDSADATDAADAAAAVAAPAPLEQPTIMPSNSYRVDSRARESESDQVRAVSAAEESTAASAKAGESASTQVESASQENEADALAQEYETAQAVQDDQATQDAQDDQATQDAQAAAPATAQTVPVKKPADLGIVRTTKVKSELEQTAKAVKGRHFFDLGHSSIYTPALGENNKASESDVPANHIVSGSDSDRISDANTTEMSLSAAELRRDQAISLGFGGSGSSAKSDDDAKLQGQGQGQGQTGEAQSQDATTNTVSASSQAALAPNMVSLADDDESNLHASAEAMAEAQLRLRRKDEFVRPKINVRSELDSTRAQLRRPK